MSRENDIRKLINRKRRRLQKLEEQEAIKGISTPPETSIEIEDLKAKIEQLQIELNDMQKDSKASSLSISSHNKKYTGINIFYKRRWYDPGGEIICQVKALDVDEIYELKPDEYTFIPMKPEINYHVIIKLPDRLNIFKWSQDVHCTLQSGEIRNYRCDPPRTSLSKPKITQID